MFPVSTKAGGQCFAFPDVCKTPAPPAPFVPVPYPNIAMCSDASGASSKVKIEGKEVCTTKTEITMSSGDEGGTAGGDAEHDGGRRDGRDARVEKSLRLQRGSLPVVVRDQTRERVHSRGATRSQRGPGADVMHATVPMQRKPMEMADRSDRVVRGQRAPLRARAASLARSFWSRTTLACTIEVCFKGKGRSR